MWRARRDGGGRSHGCQRAPGPLALVQGGGLCYHWPFLHPGIQVLATVETAVVDCVPGSRPRLERVLREAEQVRLLELFIMLFILISILLQDFRELLRNPPPNAKDADMIRKATSEGIKLPSSENPTTLSAALVEETIIVSELFNLNELSSAMLLLHGEEQLPQYPGLTR